MKSSTIISIGIPTYNSERWVTKTLNSLLVQTFSDFEIIISDNASTDQTYKICSDYASQDKRIRIYRNQKNIGAIRNQNKLREYAHSAYFMWSSSSDLYAPTYIEKCLEGFEKIPGCALSAAKTIFIDENDNIIRAYEEDMSLLDDNPVNRFNGFFDKVTYNNIFCGIIKKDILDMSVSLGQHIADEYPLMADLALRGKYLQTDEYLVYRRQCSNTTFMEMSKVEKIRFLCPYRSSLPKFYRVKYFLHLLKVIHLSKLTVTGKYRLAKPIIYKACKFY